MPDAPKVRNQATTYFSILLTGVYRKYAKHRDQTRNGTTNLKQNNHRIAFASDPMCPPTAAQAKHEFLACNARESMERKRTDKGRRGGLRVREGKGREGKEP